MRGVEIKKILIIEDESDISMVLKAYLTQAQFEVLQAYNGEQALAMFETEQPSLVLLDINLPDTDGWSLLKHIRKNSSCPVIMLTAMNKLENKLAGLNQGADDYISKPFFGEEVVARVKTVLRRSIQVTTEEVTWFGSLKIDFTAREVLLKGKPIRLMPRDLDLLLFLARHPNQSFNREQLIVAVWGMDYDGSDRAVDISINRIRQSLAEWSDKEGKIVTLRRLGYKLHVNTPS